MYTIFATILDIFGGGFMNSNITFELLKDSKENTVYKVNCHYFRIYYRGEPIPITSDMIAVMASFAEDEIREGNKSFLDDAIPFDIWDEKVYLAY